VTYFITDTVDKDGKAHGGLLRDGQQITLVNDTRDIPYERSVLDLYPLGGGPPGTSSEYILMEPQQDHVDLLLNDPQYNILSVAQLAANKWQQANGNLDGAIGECRDSRYGRIMVVNEDRWPEDERLDNYIFVLGELGRRERFFRETLNVTLDDRSTPCFCDTNYRLESRNAGRCELAFRHAFAFACNDLEAYCRGVGSIPATDRCHP